VEAKTLTAVRCKSPQRSIVAFPTQTSWPRKTVVKSTKGIIAMIFERPLTARYLQPQISPEEGLARLRQWELLELVQRQKAEERERQEDV
jgi:hypothetical protein